LKMGKEAPASPDSALAAGGSTQSHTGAPGGGSLLRKRIFLAVRLALGAIFVLASISKIAYPGAFAEIVSNYQILPAMLVNPAAIVLPWMELVLGLLLLAGLWLPGAALASLTLLTLFFAALLYNMARGINVHCGCFSVSTSGSPQMLWYLVRDSLFLLLGAALFCFVFLHGPESMTEQRSAGMK
jgi:uncharacterized membrane protein YphA (DoxX/SURF4 family)